MIVAGTGESPIPCELTISESESLDTLVGHLIKEGALAPPVSQSPRELRIKRHGLSNRQYQVARLVGAGMTNREISAELCLNEQSVKNMVSTILRRLECTNRVQLANLMNLSH